MEAINFEDPEVTKKQDDLRNLTALHPRERLQLEHNPKNMTTRILDLLSPIGKGQRGLIVAPPYTGKTMLLQNLANAITTNHPECVLIVLLIDERPEEVTEMSRSVKGEVVSSTFDEPATRHVQVAEMVIEKAKRLTEHRRDVVILLDSITRLARAYTWSRPIRDASSPRRRLHGPAAPAAVLRGGAQRRGRRLPDHHRHRPRRHGQPHGRGDLRGVQGTGNMQVTLDRRLSNRRTWPAMDVTATATRKEELLLSEFELTRSHILRRILNQMGVVEGMEFLLERMDGTSSNEEFLKAMND